jgi:hypothetical protein
MVHVYYHIYAINGVESIIDEQLSLIKKHFDFPYTLNVGISIAEDNDSIDYIINKFEKIRDVRSKGNEFVTLDLIEKDKEKFGDSDYILYIHTKGASRLKDDISNNMIAWRQYMNYFNIEKCKNVFKIFEKSQYNTYGCNFAKSDCENDASHYSGNFWWAKSSYLKTINFTNMDKTDRYNAELNFIQIGSDWKPYNVHNINKNLHSYFIKKKDYVN